MSLRAMAGGVASGSGGSVSQGYTDASGTPGNVTINTPTGRAAFALGASSCTVTNSSVTATSKVFVNLEGVDATLTSLLHCIPAAGSFTVTGLAIATAACKFSFMVVN